MIRRNQIAVILFVVIIFALVPVVAKSDSRVGILSKKSHAEKLWKRSGHAQAYATNILGAPIVYDSNTYPYFFNDLNENGEVDLGENIYPNGFTSFNSRLLKAAYNLQLSKKEPCGYIHNSHYVAQLLVDSIEHLRGDISSYTWR